MVDLEMSDGTNTRQGRGQRPDETPTHSPLTLTKESEEMLHAVDVRRPRIICSLFHHILILGPLHLVEESVGKRGVKVHSQTINNLLHWFGFADSPQQVSTAAIIMRGRQRERNSRRGFLLVGLAVVEIGEYLVDRLRPGQFQQLLQKRQLEEDPPISLMALSTNLSASRNVLPIGDHGLLQHRRKVNLQLVGRLIGVLRSDGDEKRKQKQKQRGYIISQAPAYRLSSSLLSSTPTPLAFLLKQSHQPEEGG